MTSVSFLMIALAGSLAAREVSFLAVGELPPFRQEVVDGVRREVPPPAGSVPPAEIQISVPTAEGAGEDLGKAMLQLGRKTTALQVPDGAGDLVVRAAGDSGEPWVRVNRPESGDFLVILWRGPDAPRWDRPSSLVLSPESFGAGRMVFVNVSSSPVALVSGEQRIALPPRQPWESRDAGSFQIGLPVAGGKLKRVLSMSAEARTAERQFIVIARADGPAPRLPLIATPVHLAGPKP